MKLTASLDGGGALSTAAVRAQRCGVAAEQRLGLEVARTGAATVCIDDGGLSEVLEVAWETHGSGQRNRGVALDGARARGGVASVD
ncbi:hypothetical protein M0R45_009065 [Rubus argutus]|uniref:Uncharacterized protein n=1 Tax=Rubus argutus TaxID=59490 RepID=A0AAW1Y3W0_RUBAR